MDKVRSIIIITLLSLASQVNAQEVITGVMNNPSLATGETRSKKTMLKSSAMLTLPFYDDFSYKQLTPASRLWSDRYVFINNTFSTDQRNQGIATFDALDQNGNLYPNAAAIPFAADTLTSLPINMAFNPSDSLYLSFLYEPGGIADMPETNDSLTLEFYAPSEARWQSVWRVKGGTKSGFKRVMIGITNPRYLKSGFKFRFTNYASISGIVSEPSKAGNADEWNLDCILLDKGRNINDTVMKDVAMTLPLRSLLNNYEAMPYKQFKEKAFWVEMGSWFNFNFINNDNEGRKIDRTVIIKDVYKNKTAQIIDYGAANYQASESFNIRDTLQYTFQLNSPDSALFLIKSCLGTYNTSDSLQNDTLVYRQVFSNYFAYDDGTKEAGYGINGEGADNAMLAIRYRSYITDSVAGVSICFNDAYNNANRKYFYPMVWSDNNGKPGDVLATGNEALVQTTTANNGFVTYKFGKSVPVTDYFWVGWKQVSDSYLNAGLDLNTPPLGRQYYWINGNWYESSAPGTVLLRAVMGSVGTATSTGDNPVPAADQFSVYPNPSSDIITVTAPEGDTEGYRMTIYNLAGSVVMQSGNLSNVDISNLSPGYYVVVVKSPGRKPVSKLKFIKVN
jgi:hypothetical protein